MDFPDLEGCQSFGDTLNETVENASEALSGYLLTLLEEGAQVAAASDIRSIPVPEDGFTSLVSCDINQYQDTRAIKKTLTIPAWLNERATAMGINFSKTLQDALLNKVQSK